MGHFLVDFVTCWVSFCHFFRIWASLRWWREAQIRTKCKKVEKHSKMKSKKDTIFIIIRSFSWCFVRWFLEESWEVFFCALVAEMSQMGATWDHFCSYVAAKLESWKLKFCVYQTPLFTVLRGWVRSCWATLFQDFFWDGFGDVILRLFENLRVQP